MKKKILIAIGLCMAMLGSVGQVHAYDESPLISFDGEAANYFEFNTDQNDLSENFEGMFPGETRSETFTLVNNDKRELKFYLNTKVLKDLTSTNNHAVYDITFARDGEVFYDGTIGDQGTLVDLSNQSMGENMLIATLNENESSVITMSIGIDGDSMGNVYQNAATDLQFVFSVQYDDPVTPQPTIVKRFVNAVKTGDYTTLAPYLLTLVAAVAVIVGLFVTRKKKHAKEGE